MGSDDQQLHVFFFPMMAHGHMIPLIDIARQFAVRGAKSTIITTPVNARNISDSIDRDKQSGLDISIEITPFPAAQVGLPDGCENANSLLSHDMAMKFGEAVRMLRVPFEKLLEEQKPDCVVSDVFLPWTADVAQKYGIPRICFHGTCYFSLCVTENIARNGLLDKATSDSEIFVVPDLPDQIQVSRSKFQVPASSGKTDLLEAEEKSFGFIINSFYELEPAYAEYYRKYRGRSWNIGPVSLYNRNAIDKAQRGKKGSSNDHQCINWLDSKEPNSVLYVSFGSVSRIETTQLHEIALGLEASEIPFVWVIRKPQNVEIDQCFPEGLEERMKGKGLIIREWAPQVLILDHPAVGGFMTHCGWNSTLEGICAGLPLITWPMFAEQFINEKLLTQVLKIGVSVGNQVYNSWREPKDMAVTKEMVQSAATKLMGNVEEAEDRRRRARELGQMAKRAVEKGGSSYNGLSALIEELREHSKQSFQRKQ
nr:glycosyltransferase UGT36 [Helleborus thibetanus]